MNPDISEILREWPYDPGQISARIIPGNDGLPRLQIRVELGILQLHLDGRPDGQRPEGFESLLDLYESRPEGDEDDGEEAERLSAEECEALRAEALQYYHRFVGLMVLEDYERVIRDTTRNLRVLDLCARRAAEESDRVALERFRPYVLMMRARARASQHMREGEPKAAAVAVDEGLEALRKHYADIGQPQLMERSPEARVLREVREALSPLPVSQRAELTDRLNRAIAEENYELAAILRDELRGMREDAGEGRSRGENPTDPR